MDSNDNEFTTETQQASVENAVVAENAMWSIKGLKKSAKEALKGRWKIPLISSLLIVGIMICLYCSFFPWKVLFSPYDSAISASSFIVKTFVLLVVIILAFPILTFAYLQLIQKMRKNKEKVSFNVFVEGFSFWYKGILAGLWQFLWCYLWGLLYIACSLIPIFISMYLIDSNLIVLGVIIYCITIVLLYIFIFAKYYSYCMNLYILADNPKIKIKKALKLSIKITKDYRGKLFLMDLSFIGWYLLCCLTLGIGLIFLCPYYMMTVSNACEFLRKKAIKNCVVNEEDFELAEVAASQNEVQN